MAVLACSYGLLKAGSIWYPINLLAATVYAESLKLGPAQLNSFHADSFAIALGLHGIGSLFVGLLYGAMLPMFARRPIVLGGLIGPVLWSGLLYSIMELLNPMLAGRVDWIWFMASQIAFGVVAGDPSPYRARVVVQQRADLGSAHAVCGQQHHHGSGSDPPTVCDGLPPRPTPLCPAAGAGRPPPPAALPCPSPPVRD